MMEQLLIAIGYLVGMVAFGIIATWLIQVLAICTFNGT
jgi:hypothetical protein